LVSAIGYSSLFELDGRGLEERLLEPDRLPEEPLLRLLRADRVPEPDAGVFRVGSSAAPSRDEAGERVERLRVGGGLEVEGAASFERRRGRRSSTGAARRTGVSQ
jgi:hypothetical protein